MNPSHRTNTMSAFSHEQVFSSLVPGKDNRSLRSLLPPLEEDQNRRRKKCAPVQSRCARQSQAPANAIFLARQLQQILQSGFDLLIIGLHFSQFGPFLFHHRRRGFRHKLLIFEFFGQPFPFCGQTGQFLL